LQQQQQLLQPDLPDCGVEHMHYCETSRLLAVVFADGSAALYSPAGTAGALPTAQLDFRRWLCGPAARCAGQCCAPQRRGVVVGGCALAAAPCSPGSSTMQPWQQHHAALAAAPCSPGSSTMQPWQQHLLPRSCRALEQQPFLCCHVKFVIALLCMCCM
jgi:hypothetical protein